jgi:dihydroflavonol-4-reductase
VAGKLIFVTGGTGFFGKHLVPQLLENGFRVRLMVRKTSDLSWIQKDKVELFYGDLTSPERIQEGVLGCHYVVHAAGHFKFWGPEELFWQINALGTLAVAKAAIFAGVQRLIHISAVAVTGGRRPGQVMDETVACHPRDPYQRSKYAAEKLILEMVAQDGLPAVILRPGAYYGPYGRYGFNRLFIEEPLRGLRIQVEGGRRITFPVFVPDVAEAVCRSFTGASLGEIYNICDQPVSHAQVNHIVSEISGIEPKRWNVPRRLILTLARLLEISSKITHQEPFYPLNLRYYVFYDWIVNSEKARTALNFTPTSLQEGLRQTVAWYRSQM